LPRERIKLTGSVQGVGCRPYIYRLANQCLLTGFVYNDSRGVVIEIQGPKGRIEEFVNHLSTGDCESALENPPALIRIESIERKQIPAQKSPETFQIRQSEKLTAASSQVTPDAATCPDCLRELFDPADFRHRYPFINCTNCGPRYSIIKNIPYDRPSTTMAPFEMCPRCAAQYNDPADRRFHAQPVACPACGPSLQLLDSAGSLITDDPELAIEKTANALAAGQTAAIKGIGGFHLAVDAFNDQAVQRLRKRKQRDDKPFALMARDIETVKKYCRLDPAAEKLLTSPAAPIVILPAIKNLPDKQTPPKPARQIAPSVPNGLKTLGIMLCYAPLHYLVFDRDIIELLVMTSANISDEPLICQNQRALEKLAPIADVFLTNNRDIHRPVDDSVAHIIEKKPAIIRRARGYVPTPITSKTLSAEKHILALGPDMHNTFCLAKQNQFITSEHIGDLDNAEVYKHYRQSIPHLANLFDIDPKIIACDLHPSYISSAYARTLVPPEKIIQIQHHWAHIASALLEFDHPGPVIGIAADGTGYGTDAAVWGGECIIANLDSFIRLGHIDYYPLPGANLASKQAIRPLMGLLSQISENPCQKYDWLIETMDEKIKLARQITAQINKNINTVQTSSTGRLFDAAAAALGLGLENTYQAQLPMALEAAVQPGINEKYTIEINKNPDGTFTFNPRIIIENLINDVKSGENKPYIAAKFHNSISDGFTQMAIIARKNTNIDTVALSGGVFCNKYLANRMITQLKQKGFSVLFKRLIPVNDGGISLGQAAIAASKTAKNTAYKHS
jgi:hydrogenase maturation protein HypF